jgi:hypothetical protein
MAAWRGVRPVDLVRLMVGSVFLSEGIQKFLFPADLGPGRFVKIGIPWPQVMAPFVGVVEILGGALLILNVLALYAAAALLIDISVAILSTKVPILLGRASGRSRWPSCRATGSGASCTRRGRTGACSWAAWP